jgi:hypothetical protein
MVPQLRSSRQATAATLRYGFPHGFIVYDEGYILWVEANKSELHAKVYDDWMVFREFELMV